MENADSEIPSNIRAGILYNSNILSIKDSSERVLRARTGMMWMPGLSGWAQGGDLDMAKPSVTLVGLLDEAAGPKRRCQGLTDDEVTGVLGRWAACEAWALSGKLATITELVRRRGLPGTAAHCGVPSAWDDTLTEEIALALGMSRPATMKLIDLAVALATRLDATAAALAAGEVDYLKAKIIAEATSVLDDEAAGNAEKLALMWAGGSFKGKTPGEIGKLIDRAAVAADPEAAENRRKAAEKTARVETWRETPGTMALAATGLNPQVAMEAEQAIQDTAAAYKKAGITGDMDNLRARAMTDKILGTDPLGGEQAGRGFRADVHLTLPVMFLPLLTLLGLADNPGEADGWGALDPALVRDLGTRAAAAGEASRWHLTLVDENGWAVGHGCAATKRGAKRDETGNSGAMRDSWEDTNWTLNLPGGDARTFTLNPIPVWDCDHRYETSKHDPSPLLRHLTEVRDGSCVQVGCHRPAARCDFEHAIPFEQGGKTCGCNGGPKCRRDHQIKQARNWQAIQIAPGFHQWITPSGRSYTRQPRQYPV
jgi:Domain of unknown function (DUF222)